MSDIKTLDAALNQRIIAGDIMGAFEHYYGEDIVMRENNMEPVNGKAANRTREQAFVDSVEAVHGLRLLASAVEGDVSLSEWEYDLTFKGGIRVLMAQAAVRRWSDGKVVAERFYYNKG